MAKTAAADSYRLVRKVADIAADIDERDD